MQNGVGKNSQLGNNHSGLNEVATMHDHLCSNGIYCQCIHNYQVANFTQATVEIPLCKVKGALYSPELGSLLQKSNQLLVTSYFHLM